MTNVNIDDEIYKQVSKIIKHKEINIDYPSINTFVNKAVRDKLRLELINIKELK